MRKIYLDNNATTGLDSQVLEAMSVWQTAIPANPSSVHFFGQEAQKALVQARQTVSHALRVKPDEIVFTSGATEGINMLLRGFYQAHSSCHILTSNVEHACVTQTLQALEKQGAKVSYLPAGLWGGVRPEQVKEALTPATKLLVFMSVNNETGVKTDIHGIAQVAQEAGIPLIVDGVCLLGKELFHIHPGVSAMVFSGHKVHAPLGSGCVFMRPSFKISPLLTGGGQEKGKRAGTPNLPAIVGFAKAVELLSSVLPAATERMETLTKRLTHGLASKLDSIVVHGQGPRICNTAYIGFPGVDAESLLIQLSLSGIAVSHGSACSSGSLEPSSVLLKMGIPPQLARSSLRFSLSRLTTATEIDEVVDVVAQLAR